MGKVKSQSVQGPSRRQLSAEIVDLVRDSGKKVRTLFPW